jgi:hypothetical protein
MLVTGVVPLEETAGEEEEDAALLREMAEGAQKSLRSFSMIQRSNTAEFERGR